MSFEPQIIFEDNHLLVVNKRAGELVQGDRTKDLPLSELLKTYLVEKHNKPGQAYLGVAHRLDRPTTGVVVFAKTSKALTRLNKMFAEKKIDKIYWAIVKGKPQKRSQVLHHHMVRIERINKSIAYSLKVPNSKKASLHYKVKKLFQNHTFLEIFLETGRHHQIRAQLSEIGHSIRGDLKYGYPRSNPDGGIHLHARSLTLTHPVTQKKMCFVAPLPKDPLWDACAIGPTPLISFL